MTGTDGKARTSVLGQGETLDLPTVPLVPPVTVQLAARACESQRPPYGRKNEPGSVTSDRNDHCEAVHGDATQRSAPEHE